MKLVVSLGMIFTFMLIPQAFAYGYTNSKGKLSTDMVTITIT